jgi:hypothetical protein
MTFTFEDFKEDKKRNVLELEQQIEDIKAPSGYKRFTEHPDSEIIPVLRAWNKLEFTYTLDSCSGTPNDHWGKYKTGHWNYRWDGERLGWLMAHAYKHDQRLENFLDGLKNIENIKIKTSDFSGPMYQDENNDYFRKIILIILKIPVSDEMAQKDLLYLNRCWDKVTEVLTDFYKKIN